MNKFISALLLSVIGVCLKGQISPRPGFHELPDSSLTSTIYCPNMPLVTGQTEYHSWDFGDNQTQAYSGHKRFVTHKYASQGWYNVTRKSVITNIRQDTVSSLIFTDSIPVGFVHKTVGCDVKLLAPDTIDYFSPVVVLDKSDTCTSTNMLTLKRITILNEGSLFYESSSPTNRWTGFSSVTSPFRKIGLNEVKVTTQYYDSTALMFEDYNVVSFYIDPQIDAWSSISSTQLGNGEVSCAPTYGSNGFDPNLHKEHFNWSVWYNGKYTQSSSVQNPVFSFENSGDYVVRLTYEIEDTASKKVVGLGLSYDTISIAPSNSCVAQFDYEFTWSSISTVDFSNTSKNLFAQGTTEDFFEWDFGDGTVSTDKEPRHSYSRYGTYLVRLIHRVGDANYNTVCADTLEKVIKIGTGCYASFYQDSTSSTSTSLAIYNHSNPDNIGGITVSYKWDFGDGTTSNQAYPTHTYQGNGPYNLCLTVTAVDSSNVTCSSYYCRTVGLDSVGNVVLKRTGFTINILDPNATVSQVEHKALELAIYPNPATDHVTIEGIDGKATWQLCDLQGRKIVQGVLNPSDNQIDVSFINAGLYIIKIEKSGVLKSARLNIK